MSPPPSPPRVVLWTGPRHSGKTTAARRLAARLRGQGYGVAGLLAPSLWREGRLEGFDAEDLATGRRAPLLRRGGVPDVGGFRLLAAGEALGRAALSPAAAAGADLVVLDELGPLELGGGGWRAEADRLAAGPAWLLLVVRDALAGEAAALFGGAEAVSAGPAGEERVAALLGLQGPSQEGSRGGRGRRP